MNRGFKTDFYWKLQRLVDNIAIYKEIFGGEPTSKPPLRSSMGNSTNQNISKPTSEARKSRWILRKGAINKTSLSPSKKPRSRHSSSKGSSFRKNSKGSFILKASPLRSSQKSSGKPTEEPEGRSPYVLKKKLRKFRHPQKAKILINSEKEIHLEKSWKEQENKMKMITEETKSMLHESDRSIPWLNTDFLQNDIFENSKHLLNESTRNSRIHTRRHSKHMEEKKHITRKQSVISVINTGNLLAPPQSNFRNSIKLTTRPNYPDLPNNCVSTSRKDLSHKSAKRNFKISANLLNPPKCSKDHAAFVNSKNSLFFRNKKFREKVNELKRNTVARRRHARSTFSAQDCAKQCVKVYENPLFKDQNFEKNKDRFPKENQLNVDIHTGFGHCSSVQNSADFQHDKDFKMIQKLSKASLFKYSKNYSRVLSNSHENSHEISQSGEQAIQQNSSRNVTNSLTKALSKNQGRNMLTNRVSHLGLTNNSHDLEDFLRSTVEKTFRPARIYLNNPFTERSQGPSS